MPDDVHPESQVQQAAHLLRQGRLVAFPTETVYGLGADATQPDAVAKIFAAKGRPAGNPLIVHVADIAIARRYVADWPDRAQKLAEAFWPGPLSLILSRGDAIAPAVAADGPTVAIRVPRHPVALALLRAFDGPVAAPSANRSNHISPTTAGHVRQELGDLVDLVLDGGACDVGIESTVLDLSGPRLRILRPGDITAEQIAAVVNEPVELLTGHVVQADDSAISPGQQAVHYAPRTPAYRFESHQLQEVLRWQMHQTGRVAVIRLAPGRPAHPGQVSDDVSDQPARQSVPSADTPGAAPLAAGDASRAPGKSPHAPDQTLGQNILPADPARYAHDLYATLRRLDEANLESMAIELPPDQPEWLAVRDRLFRAARPWNKS